VLEKSRKIPQSITSKLYAPNAPLKQVVVFNVFLSNPAKNGIYHTRRLSIFPTFLAKTNGPDI